MKAKPLLIGLLAAHGVVWVAGMMQSERESKTGRDPDRMERQIDAHKVRVLQGPPVAGAAPLADAGAAAGAAASSAGAAKPAATDAEREAAARLEAERLAAEKAAADKAAAEKAAADKAKREQQAKEQKEKEQRDKEQREAAAKAERERQLKLACVEFSAVPVTALRKLETQIDKIAPNARVSSRVIESAPDSYMVMLPPSRSRADAERLVDQLRSAGVRDLFLVQEPGINYLAISLGLYRNEDSAKTVAQDIRARGFTQVQVQGRASNAAKTAVITIREADEGETRKIAALRRDVPTAELRECKGR